MDHEVDAPNYKFVSLPKCEAWIHFSKDLRFEVQKMPNPWVRFWHKVILGFDYSRKEDGR